MAAIFYPMFTLALWALFRRTRKLLHEPISPPARAKLLLAVIMALVYDNLVISSGRLLGEGPLLEALSLPRFLFRALFLPMVLVVGVEYARRADLAWARQKITLAGAWAAALALAGWEGTSVYGQTLLAREFSGTLRYVSTAGEGPGLAAWAPALVTLVVGVFLWKPARWPWLFAGAVGMLAGNAVPGRVAGPLLGAAAEVLWVWALVATERRVEEMGLEISGTEVEARLERLTPPGK